MNDNDNIRKGDLYTIIEDYDNSFIKKKNRKDSNKYLEKETKI